ncbi:phosphotransferase family protein [Sporichthya polymorpha]|uniref:phosphotransferase family protein n=1 Tax=Sporichthya polymorpha TaxID=35751 RepID=UPI00036FD129|nr:phosphotransferase family protein [Sporichthya polymorpha]
MSAEAGPTVVAKVARSRDEALAPQIERWLRSAVPGFENAQVRGLRSSDASGLSGETHLVDCLLDSAGGPAERTVVLRKDVLENQTNPQSDFTTLLRVQRALGDLGTLPVPRVLGVEQSPAVLGARFVVMEFVDGLIPADVPTYAAAGFVHDATPARRAAMWTSGVDFLVALHALDPRELGLADLGFGAPGADHVERTVNHAVALFRAEAGTRSNPLIERAIEWMTAARPSAGRDCICWGDARIGNMIWRDFTCVGVIDWEMASVGSAGVDLGWWSFFHRWSTHGQGNPDLSGMCVGAELADLYAARGGDKIENFTFYEVLAAVRGLSIWLRMYAAMHAQGALPEMDPLADEIHMVRVLAALMDEAS